MHTYASVCRVVLVTKVRDALKNKQKYFYENDSCGSCGSRIKNGNFDGKKKQLILMLEYNPWAAVTVMLVKRRVYKWVVRRG